MKSSLNASTTKILPFTCGHNHNMRKKAQLQNIPKSVLYAGSKIKMKSLKKRLAAVARFIPSGAKAADIGTDHAYLPVYLVESGICGRVIATDISCGPLVSAGRTVKEHDLEEKIELRLGNGLEAIKPGEVDVIIIAGLGGNTIKRLLEASPEVLEDVKRLVLQPMGDESLLRVWLAGRGWQITDEVLVEEGGKLYVVIVAEPGRDETEDPLLLEMGPRLVEKRDPLLAAYLDEQEDKYLAILEGLAKSRRREAAAKSVFYEKRLAKIREVKSWL